MNRRTLALAVSLGGLFLDSPIAYAQQPQQSPAEQALGSKLMQEINAGLQCTQNLISMQQQLAAAIKERDELKAKYEPKVEPPK
jgi:hypothetical protein